MTQTARTIAEILALAADNTSQRISPLDLRDVIATLQVKFGGLLVVDGDEAATVITNTTDYFDLAGTFTLSTPAEQFDQSAGNGLLTYTGQPDIAAVLMGQTSLIAASATQTCEVRLEKNGADVVRTAAESIVLSTGAVNAALLGITSLSNGDTVNLAVRNTTDSVNVTANEAHFLAIGIAT